MQTLPDEIQKLITARVDTIINIVYKEYVRYLVGFIRELMLRYSIKDTALWKQLNANILVEAGAVREKQKLEIPTGVIAVMSHFMDLFYAMEKLDGTIAAMRAIVNKPVYSELMRAQNALDVYRNNLDTLAAMDKVLKRQSNTNASQLNPKIFAFIEERVHFVENYTLLHNIMVSSKPNDLLLYAMKTVVKNGDNAEPGSLIYKLMQRVENLKDEALWAVDTTIPNICTSKYVGGVSVEKNTVGGNADNKAEDAISEETKLQQQLMLLMRSKITPMSQWLTIVELFAKWNGEYNPINSIHVNLRRLCTLAEANILVIADTTADKIVEFCQDSINAPENITGPEDGICEKLLRRFDTVKEVPVEEVKNPPTLKSIFSTYMREDIDESRWMVVECALFRRYRIMRGCVLEGSEEPWVTGDFVRDIMAGVDMRQHNISTLCERAVCLKAVDKKHRAFISEFESAVENRVLAESVKAEIKKLVCESMTGELTREVERRQDFITVPRDFFDFITSDEQITRMRKLISGIIYNRIQKPKKRRTLEISVSYAINLDIVVTKFMREYETSAVIVRNSGKVISQNLTADRTMVRYLSGWYEQIIDTTLPILDTTPGNLDELQFGIKEFYIRNHYLNR